METIVGCDRRSGLKVVLAMRLRLFQAVYHQHRDALRDVAERLKLAAAGGEEKRRAEDGAAVLLSLLGGGIGTVVGGVSGGLWGVLGAVGNAVYARFFGHANPVGASMGFMGGALGGLLGGAFSGAIACTVEVAAATSGRPIHSGFSQLLWFSVGFATGGAIGSTFVGSVGAAGGAIGGGLGALHARVVSTYISACTTNYTPREQDSGAEKTIGRQLSGSLAPLEAELQSIQRACGEMAPGYALHELPGQVARTRSAVRALRESLGASERVRWWPRSAPCWEDAARRWEEALRQLEMMEEETNKVLLSLEICD